MRERPGGGYNLANPVYHRHRHPSVSGFTFSIPFNYEQARAKAVHHCVYNNEKTQPLRRRLMVPTAAVVLQVQQAKH